MTKGAAYIFSELKMRGINAELVTEFAKDKVWENNDEVFKNQAYIFGKQSYKMSRCRDKVDVIITDSPLPLSIFYNHDKVLGEDFNRTVMNVFNSYNNINFLLLSVVNVKSVVKKNQEIKCYISQLALLNHDVDTDENKIIMLYDTDINVELPPYIKMKFDEAGVSNPLQYH